MTKFKTGDRVVLAKDHSRYGRVAAVSGDGKRVFVRWWNREVGQYSPNSLLLQEVAREMDEAAESAPGAREVWN